MTTKKQYITYTDTSTTYHEIDKTFELPKEAVTDYYHTIGFVAGFLIKCSKYDYQGYSIWLNGKNLEDRFTSLRKARAAAVKMAKQY